MTRFAESRFSVGSNSKSAQKNYADNYDRIFGKKAELPTEEAKCAREKFEAWQDGYVDDDGEFRQG